MCVCVCVCACVCRLDLVARGDILSTVTSARATSPGADNEAINRERPLSFIHFQAIARSPFFLHCFSFFFIVVFVDRFQLDTPLHRGFTGFYLVLTEFCLVLLLGYSRFHHVLREFDLIEPLYLVCTGFSWVAPSFT